MKRAGPPAYEPFETLVLSLQIKPGDTVIDLGAFHGHYATRFSSYVGSEGSVYAFEPDPDAFKALSLNVERLQLNNVTLENRAVANKTGKLRLYPTRAQPGDYRVFDSGDGRDSFEINAVRLDHYFKGTCRKIDFIKMDIQGSEPGAIEGAQKILRDNLHLGMALEFCPFLLRLFGADPLDFLKTLLDHGFFLRNIMEREKTLDPVHDIQYLVSRYDGNAGTYTNLLATR